MCYGINLAELWITVQLWLFCVADWAWTDPACPGLWYKSELTVPSAQRIKTNNIHTVYWNVIFYTISGYVEQNFGCLYRILEVWNISWHILQLLLVGKHRILKLYFLQVGLSKQAIIYLVAVKRTGEWISRSVSLSINNLKTALAIMWK